MIDISISKLAAKHGIVPLKKYGQNFIFDETLCDRIVKHAFISKNDTLLEIGPGTAGLTRSILKLPIEKLIIIEKDSRCLSLLEEIKKHYQSLDIIHNDALKLKLSDIQQDTKFNIVSNLPYNIGTKLLINWIYQIKHIKSMTLMLQKEVVDRIISKDGVKTYGRLSVICQLMFKLEKCFDVSPKAFYPQPKIFSSVIHLVPKKDYLDHSTLLALEKVTAYAFSEKRKMIKSSLKKLSPNINEILESLQINTSLRAENLSPADYLNIVRSFNFL